MQILAGTHHPEGRVAASVGTTYARRMHDGSTEIHRKATGADAAGWALDYVTGPPELLRTEPTPS